MNVLQMPIKLTNRKVWYHMKEIDYENDIKKVYQQLHVDKHQVTVLKQRLEKEKEKISVVHFKNMQQRQLFA